MICVYIIMTSVLLVQDIANFMLLKSAIILTVLDPNLSPFPSCT